MKTKSPEELKRDYYKRRKFGRSLLDAPITIVQRDKHYLINPVTLKMSIVFYVYLGEGPRAGSAKMYELVICKESNDIYSIVDCDNCGSAVPYYIGLDEEWKCRTIREFYSAS